MRLQMTLFMPGRFGILRVPSTPSFLHPLPMQSFDTNACAFLSSFVDVWALENNALRRIDGVPSKLT